jgi:hypothetical protein
LLTWGATANFTEKYLVYMGTDGGGTQLPRNIFNAYNLTATQLGFPVTMRPATAYYYTVVAVNIVGPSLNCPIRSFATEPAAVAFPKYCQNFTTYQMPTGWLNDPDDGTETWVISTSTNYGPRTDHTTGTGYLAYVRDGYPYSPTVNLLTPFFDIRPFLNPVLDFYVWISASQSLTTFHVDASRDGTHWTRDLAVVPAVYQVWQPIRVDIYNYISASARIRFRVSKNSTSPSFNNDIAIDDICIQEGPAFITVRPTTGTDGVQDSTTGAVTQPTQSTDGQSTVGQSSTSGQQSSTSAGSSSRTTEATISSASSIKSILLLSVLQVVLLLVSM